MARSAIGRLFPNNADAAENFTNVHGALSHLPNGLSPGIKDRLNSAIKQLQNSQTGYERESSRFREKPYRNFAGKNTYF
jgi:hypothetical protein